LNIPGLDIFFLVYSLVMIVLQSVHLARKLKEEEEKSADKDVVWHVLRKIYMHGVLKPTVGEAKDILKKVAEKGDNSRTAADS
jgi:hypothetical protein